MCRHQGSTNKQCICIWLWFLQVGTKGHVHVASPRTKGDVLVPSARVLFSGSPVQTKGDVLVSSACLLPIAVAIVSFCQTLLPLLRSAYFWLCPATPISLSHSWTKRSLIVTYFGLDLLFSRLFSP